MFMLFLWGGKESLAFSVCTAAGRNSSLLRRLTEWGEVGSPPALILSWHCAAKTPPTATSTATSAGLRAQQSWLGGSDTWLLPSHPLTATCLPVEQLPPSSASLMLARLEDPHSETRQLVPIFLEMVTGIAWFSEDMKAWDVSWGNWFLMLYLTIGPSLLLSKTLHSIGFTIWLFNVRLHEAKPSLQPLKDTVPKRTYKSFWILYFYRNCNWVAKHSKKKVPVLLLKFFGLF